MICPNCNNTDNDLDAVFCHNCGKEMRPPVASIVELDSKKLKIRNNGRTYFFSILFVVVGISVSYFYLKTASQPEQSSSVDTINTELNVNVDLPGLYDVLQSYNNTKNTFKMTAEIRYDSLADIFRMVIVSKYDPEFHSFIVTSENKAISETLGEGVILYKEKIDKTIIEFKNNNIIWIFTK